ncbi:MAG TPA: YkgJ family cysteine cluster protein [Candidatus Eisenbacteria bacterium]
MIPQEDDKAWTVLGVELGTPDGPLRGQVQIPTGPLTLSEIVPSALELTNILASRANARSERRGLPVSCRAGCGACCRQMVPLSIPEVFYLMERIAEMEPAARDVAVNRFMAIDRRLDMAGMVEPLLDLKVAADPQRALNQTYFEMKMACPFLVDESCSIHSVRPVACREYSVTNNPKFCANPYAGGIDKVPMPLPLSAALAWLASERLGVPPMLIPMTLVPRWASENAELAEQRWPGVELFSQFMKIAGSPPPEWAMNPDAPPAGN